MASQTYAYDLLSNENHSFTVEFDTYKPRPHFIVLAKQQEDIKPPDFGSTTPEQREKLMEAVRSMMSRFSISSGILSIRRGSWLRKIGRGETFHAHICVDVELYLQVFEQEKHNIFDWSDQRYAKYTKRVGDYPEEDHFDEDVAAFEELRREAVDLPHVQLPIVGESGITTALHQSHPKIGFFGKKDEISSEDVVWTMENFAKDLGLTNYVLKTDPAFDKSYGCQLCLYLGSVPTEDWNFVSKKDGEEVLGYIVTTVPRFYELCPVEQREQWFTAFKGSEFACLT
ncbi:Hypothetical predicted protein [Paramuricea clavata]|uniref:Uncharacterized protein n=1 Tax=Paramuricea clavata TaxID=317549 RepID=A0A6S7GQN4_PARCT|nr:Hypothetical predicted protein [Paramuricea clavata]